MSFMMRSWYHLKAHALLRCRQQELSLLAFYFLTLFFGTFLVVYIGFFGSLFDVWLRGEVETFPICLEKVGGSIPGRGE